MAGIGRRARALGAALALTVVVPTMSGQAAAAAAAPDRADAATMVAAPQQAPSTYANPVAGGFTGNPSIIKAGSTYYAYADGFDYILNSYNIRVMSSPDLVSWTGVGGAMPNGQTGGWAVGSSGWNFTSPSVGHFPSNPASQRYVLYYTGVHATTGATCIGVATAGSPAGPFTGAAQPLICPSGGAQDPGFVAQSAGTPIPQLVYRKNGADAGLYNQVLSPDGLSVSSSLPTPYLLYRAQPSWWHQGVVQRPSLVPAPDGRLYLFFAGGPATSSGRAIGWTPCREGFGVVHSCTDQTHLGTWMAGTSQVATPSGPQVFQDGSSWWMVYDGRLPSSCSGGTCTGTRELRIDKLCFDHAVPRTNGPTTGAQPFARSTDCSTDVPGQPLNVGSVADDLAVPQPPRVVGRDGGHTAPVGGRVLWGFSDTGLRNPGGYITNGTAALGVPAPGATDAAWATEPLDANGAPLPFIPYTANDTKPEGGQWLIWVGGIEGGVDLPSGQGLVFFIRLRQGYDFHSIGFARVSQGSNQVDRSPAVSPLACNPTCLFDADVVADQADGAHYLRPFIHDGYLYLTGTSSVGTKLARAPLNQIDTRSAWRFWDGSTWVADFTQAAPVPGLGGTVDYNPYLDRFVTVGGAPDVHVRTSTSLTGSWSTPQTVYSPTTACPGVNGVRAWINHPDLAMDGGRRLALSYYRPGDTSAGGTCPYQVRLAYVTLQ